MTQKMGAHNVIDDAEEEMEEDAEQVGEVSRKQIERESQMEQRSKRKK